MASFAICMKPCAHVKQPTRIISTYSESVTLAHVFQDIHPDVEKGYTTTCHGTSSPLIADAFELDWATPLRDLKDLGVKSLSFQCSPAAEEEKEKETATPTPNPNAFHVLMNASRHCWY
eukprot:TRINITY_DN11188_c0_g3_i1.p1 TRINITY_DN11188_c0_g3~~TRINITY_DN11188_c0_g3_i1.p1  ORF type:complete len:119 (-),score=12.39 TRINITY_DN11188_c0_g3_i1:78-434(-)